jgi:hypothetical protein
MTSVLLTVCFFLWRHTNLVRVKWNDICGSFVSIIFAAYIIRCIFKLDVNHFSIGDFLPEWTEGMSYFLYLSVIRLHLYHSIFHVSVSFQLQFVSFDSVKCKCITYICLRLTVQMPYFGETFPLIFIHSFVGSFLLMRQ